MPYPYLRGFYTEFSFYYYYYYSSLLSVVISVIIQPIIHVIMRSHAFTALRFGLLFLYYSLPLSLSHSLSLKVFGTKSSGRIEQIEKVALLTLLMATTMTTITTMVMTITGLPGLISLLSTKSSV